MYGSSELSQKANPLLIKGQNQNNHPVFYKTKPSSPQGLDVKTLGTLPSAQHGDLIKITTQNDIK
jgi:hypothetical protein